ncbi:MAG TPA: TrkA family potassium uptake protein [Beutenbergiaceae bacterium]|nr:TrkA family potassium uptake protein [Beutenbergiaceae bacterium]
MAKLTPTDLGPDAAVLVIGMGRFGAAIATTLDEAGTDVLAVEKDPHLIQTWSGRLPIVEADTTNPEALEQLGAREFPIAVVGIGSSLEASVLTTGNLVDIGTQLIWAKAISAEHGRILKRIGAHHVVYPEHDAGTRVAHLVSGRMLDFIEMEDDFTIVKMRAPKSIQGATIGHSQIRSKFGVTVLGMKRAGQPFVYTTDTTRIEEDDMLILSGDTTHLEEFARRA